MSAVNLQKSIKILKKCYNGIDKEGDVILDSTKLNDKLAFGVALNRLKMAIESEEITWKEFQKELKKKSERKWLGK